MNRILSSDPFSYPLHYIRSCLLSTGKERIPLLFCYLLLHLTLNESQASESHLRRHYADLSTKPFFPGLVRYMASGPVLAMVWQGEGVVRAGRKILGETNPAASKPGSIRGDLCIQV